MAESHMQSVERPSFLRSELEKQSNRHKSVHIERCEMDSLFASPVGQNVTVRRGARRHHPERSRMGGNQS